MRLNHLDLPVPDVAKARDFFTTWLGFTHERTLGRDGLCILRDGGDLVLVLSRLQADGPQAFPETFHIGFHLPSEQAVSDLYGALAAAGHADEPPAQGRGAFAFYFAAPGGILVEVAYRP